MSERVPEGWARIKLGNFGTFSTSSVDKKSKDDEISVKLLNYMDVYRNDVLSSTFPFQSVTAPAKQVSSSSVKNGDVFFTPSSETPDDIGHSAVFLGDADNLVHSYHTIRFRCSANIQFDDNYKAYAFKGQATYDYFRKRVTGSTRFTVSLPIFNELEVNLPSLPEQKKIASILTSVDEIIENTQKQIDKLQDLKKATMNELLTKGIGHTEFKDSELGRIPENWEVKTLGEVLDRIVGGGTPSRDNPNFWGNGIPWATVKDFTKKRLTSTQESITQEGLKNSSSNLIPKGTIIISTRMAVGKAVIFDKDVTINQDLKALFPKPFINTEYLLQWFDFKLDLIEALGIGSTVKGIRLEILRNISFLTPPLDEQIEISTILNSIENQIYIKNQEITKIRSIKKSLMQDLLTGKVRVKVN